MHITLSLLTLKPGANAARWALAQMATAPRQLRRVAGLRFFQLLGSGADNGFGFWPNLRRYGFMATWASPEAAAEFFATHPVWAAYQQRSTECWTAELAPLQAHGTWDDVLPFGEPAAGGGRAEGPVAVLTRASIRLRRAPRFWQFVEPTSRALAGAEGLQLAIGLGELPLVRQATFSVWESVQAMQQYAYRDVRHREVIQLTRREGWYSEELFARFQVLSSSGTVDGRNPLG
ncbi:spheroidene monooxygenase [Hymenobacter cheonanensis]|uniref:spheroidene monooxygenase n=1 Tax=Hymenobacter sp. CA2-7 TaxID=3063993 RepID=UPI0027124B78|nr:spheroidene monooxygenase [Hymenobacter sp. CA2-7]MDO7888001.1 spheroidene monooxygenase [Hymenobacter sp. CA2-7]